MTANQKRFKDAQVTAKALKKKNPKLTHQQALKLAFAKTVVKAPAKKKAAPKKKVTGVKTKSRQHTDKNKITANIQIGGSNIYSIRDRIEKDIQHYMQAIDRVKKSMILEMEHPEQKKRAREAIASMRKVVATMKKDLSEHNRMISKLMK